MVAAPANLRGSGHPRRGRYEEYHPHGSTAWWSNDGNAEVSRKRYRYTGMERDEETGLQCHGVRYYAPWLGRWMSADPIGLGDGVNRYAYCHGGPVGGRDSTGLATTQTLDQILDEDGVVTPPAVQELTTPERQGLRQGLHAVIDDPFFQTLGDDTIDQMDIHTALTRMDDLADLLSDSRITVVKTKLGKGIGTTSAGANATFTIRLDESLFEVGQEEDLLEVLLHELVHVDDQTKNPALTSSNQRLAQLAAHAGTAGLLADRAAGQDRAYEDAVAGLLASRDLTSGRKLTGSQLAEASRLLRVRDDEETSAYQVSAAFALLVTAHNMPAPSQPQTTSFLNREFLAAYGKSPTTGLTQLYMVPASRIYARAAVLVGP